VISDIPRVKMQPSAPDGGPGAGEVLAHAREHDCNRPRGKTSVSGSRLDGDRGMKWLVVNADDAGLDSETDAAILRCAREGIVRSVSVVAGGPTAANFVTKALHEGLDMGLHVNLTQGSAVAGRASTLTDSRGFFRGPKGDVWRRAVAGRLDPNEVRAEVLAQWQRLCDLGAQPTHIDGHNHVHVFPWVGDALRTLGEDVWMRIPEDSRCPASSRPALPDILEVWAKALRPAWRTVEQFTGFDFSCVPTLETFLTCVTEPAATLEFMVHPGSRPGSAFSDSALRDREVQTLCSPDLKRQLRDRGWQPTSFQELGCASR